jgi:hypothetical protein
MKAISFFLRPAKANATRATPFLQTDLHAWLREQARAELRHYVDHHPGLSADAYKEDPNRFDYDGTRPRRRSVVSWGYQKLRSDARYAGALAEKEAALRRRWDLSDRTRIDPR